MLKKLGDPLKVLDSVHARPYRFNRRLGTGISVFNPGDRRSQRNVRTDETVQRTLNGLFSPSGKVPYLYSGYAKVNNGVITSYSIHYTKLYDLKTLSEVIDTLNQDHDITKRFGQKGLGP